ncbi:MAG: hypothetical protein LC789_11315 [Actinobacteria bacterium]|nr:hypothetical protein [Actinomycetota bacterium]MCA1721147.1 hypothetical protein [Actinomycetota bacterium]
MDQDDRRLARRLDREARAAGKVAVRAARVHAKAVARRERVLRRARRHLPGEIAVAVGSVAVGAATASQAFLLAGGAAGLCALRNGLRLIRPPEVPEAPALPALRVPPAPPPGSAAFAAVRRLEAARLSLARLVPLVAPAGRDAADEAWRTAGEADLALRWQAARLAAVEPHRGAEPALVDQLYTGVVAQERLVAGLADLVSASADPLATLRLQDATDALHGLAQGLREVR